MDEEQREPEGGTIRKSERRETRKYHRFTEEFKREAVRLTQQPDRTVAGVARSLGIDANSLSLWRKQFGATVAADPRPPKTRDEWFAEQSREMAELKRKLLEVEQERDILKKAMGVISRPSR